MLVSGTKEAGFMDNFFAFSFCIFFNKTHLNIWHMHF